MKPRAHEIAALGDSLIATARVQVSLTDIWHTWTTAAPRFVGNPDQATALHDALTALAAENQIELPVGSWDSSTVPPLPRWVRVPANRAPRRRSTWQQFPWAPELGWVASLQSLSEERFDDLVAIHNWLISNRQASAVPIRYRSVELFGDEKHLGTLARTQLFGPGRLSLDLLCCRRLPPPLPAIPVGTGPDILVVENSDPYWVAADVLAEMDDHPIRAVAWGSGTAFPAQVENLGVDIAGGGPVSGIAWYWGDFDPRGVRIGADAASASTAHRGVTIRPAAGLWEAMASCTPQMEGTIIWPAEPAAAEWLGPELWTSLEPVRTATARIAQEAVPNTAISSWARSL
jgi:hypothetical protein